MRSSHLAPPPFSRQVVVAVANDAVVMISHALQVDQSQHTHIISSHLAPPPFSCQDVVVANDAALLLCYHALQALFHQSQHGRAHTHTHTTL